VRISPKHILISRMAQEVRGKLEGGACNGEYLQWIGGGFERYGFLSEGDVLVGASSCELEDVKVEELRSGGVLSYVHLKPSPKAISISAHLTNRLCIYQKAS
jgi:hypothetical protein